MRLPVWLGVAIVGLGMALPARAQLLTPFTQSGRASSLSGSASRTSIINVPIDTSLAVAPFPSASQSSSGFLSRLFTGLHFPGFPMNQGQSALPAPTSFASTHYQSGKTVSQELKFPNLTASSIPSLLGH